MPHSSNNRPLKRVALAAAAVSILLGGVACSAESSTAASTSKTFAVPATTLTMTSTGGHKLAFYVTPGRAPAIVLDAGGGLDHSYWKKLVPVLARETGSEIITYDRSGEGKSSDVPGAFDPKAAADDLDIGLKQVGVTHDVVLVSHSEAGEIATNLVNDHPGVVAGAVLVDASLPEFYSADETARIVGANTPQVAALKKQPLTQATRQLLSAAENYGPAHSVYHSMTWPASVPVNVIASTSTPFNTKIDARRWHDAQKEFANAASNRRLTTLKSSHDIPLDRPAAVEAQIENMVKRVG